MTFVYPYGLILFLLIPLLFYFSWHALANLSILQKRILLGLRITALVFLILGISGLAIKIKSDKVCTIFLLDISNSMSGLSQEDGIKVIKNLVRLKHKKEQFGLIVFGRNPGVEIEPTYNFDIKQINSVIDKNYTNLESAVDLAISIFPDNTVKRIVCITDGNQNQSDVIPKSIEARMKNITIDVISPGDKVIKKEVWIKDVIAPQRVRLNQKFQIIVNFGTLQENAHGTLKIFKDGVFESQTKIELRRFRENNFYFEQSLSGEGIYQYEFILESNDDTHPENNIAGAIVYAGSKPKIFYVRPDNAIAGSYGTISFPESFEVDSGTPTSLLAGLDNLWQYDLVIFQDVSANHLNRASMEALNHYVRDQGGGFIMLGGMESLRPGGYSETEIGQMLPVYLDPEPDAKGEGLSLVFAIDKSGSMAQKHGSKTKLRVVIDTIDEILHLLKKNDKLGIVIFDKLPGIVLPIQSHENFQEIKNELDSVKAQGGTDIYKSLKTSYELFKDLPSKFKHIILVSDGQTDHADFSELLKAMREEKITLSTIGIGDNVNRTFLESLAGQCRGRSYITQELDNLGDIFKRETAMASRSWFKEGELATRAFRPHEITRGISTDSLPPLRGLILTSSKSQNYDIIVSGQSTPVLSAWQYGLGRTSILTTNLFSEWGSNWFEWDGFPQFWSQLIRWNTRNISSGQWDVKTRWERDQIRIHLEAIKKDGGFEDFLTLKGMVKTPDHLEVAVDFKQIGPGRYEAFCPAKTSGFYVLNLFCEEEGDVIFKQSCGLFIASLPEYMVFGTNWSLLEEMCRLTGGRRYNNAGELYDNVNRETSTLVMYNCWRILILSALFLFVIEIAIRKLRF